MRGFREVGWLQTFSFLPMLSILTQVFCAGPPIAITIELGKLPNLTDEGSNGANTIKNKRGIHLTQVSAIYCAWQFFSKLISVARIV
jgi:hypothetical protein